MVECIDRLTHRLNGGLLLKILQGERARNFREAAALVLKESGSSDISLEVIELLTSAIDEDKYHGEAEKNIRIAIRDRYRKNPTWESEQWYIPIPMLHYDTRDIPHLTIEIRVYLVAVAEVETTDDFYCVTLVGVIGKSEMLELPMVFLYGTLGDDLGRFRVLARSAGDTTWEIPGGKPVKLPNEFLAKFSQTLEGQSVARWLGSFGAQSKRVRPLVVGSLLGLQSMEKAKPIPPGQQAWSRELVIKTLEGLGYSTKEAEEMFNRVAPTLRAEYSLEEVIRLVLQQAGKEG